MIQSRLDCEIDCLDQKILSPIETFVTVFGISSIKRELIRQALAVLMGTVYTVYEAKLSIQWFLAVWRQKLNFVILGAINSRFPFEVFDLEQQTDDKKSLKCFHPDQIVKQTVQIRKFLLPVKQFVTVFGISSI